MYSQLPILFYLEGVKRLISYFFLTKRKKNLIIKKKFLFLPTLIKVYTNYLISNEFE